MILIFLLFFAFPNYVQNERTIDALRPTLLLKEGIRKVLENELPSSKDELPLKAKPSIDFPEFHINASVEACFFLPFLTFMAKRM